jgi:hypothetical protein
MNLIQFGTAIVNLDQVTCIRELSVTDGSGQPGPPCYRIEFDNHEAIEIVSHAGEVQQWLAGATIIRMPAP